MADWTWWVCATVSGAAAFACTTESGWSESSAMTLIGLLLTGCADWGTNLVVADGVSPADTLGATTNTDISTTADNPTMTRMLGTRTSPPQSSAQVQTRPNSRPCICVINVAQRTLGVNGRAGRPRWRTDLIARTAKFAMAPVADRDRGHRAKMV